MAENLNHLSTALLRLYVTKTKIVFFLTLEDFKGVNFSSWNFTTEQFQFVMVSHETRRVMLNSDICLYLPISAALSKIENRLIQKKNSLVIILLKHQTKLFWTLIAMI